MNEFNLDKIVEYLPLLVPVLIIELVLIIVALVSISKQTEFKIGNKLIWVIVVLCLQMVGPILYFCFGRNNE